MAYSKVILLTGGAGFIASHVARRLAHRYPEYKIIALDKLDYCASLLNLESVVDLPNFQFVKGDIRSLDLLHHIFYKEEVSIVMHFAAQSHVDNSFENSFEFTRNNTEGTHAVLEAAKQAGCVSKFIHVSTDEVYGETSFEQDKSNTEHATVLTPTNPYSATKAGAEMLVMAYGRSYGLPFIITRGNNVYGPNQYPEKAVAKFAVLALRGDKISIHGDGLATRSYMHVDDAASAFDVILHHGNVFEVYNIGAHEERTIVSVARDICRLTGRDPIDFITHVRDRAFNDRRYYIDCSKLRSLGWIQEKTWETGLEETIDWYRVTDLARYWKRYKSALVPHSGEEDSGEEDLLLSADNSKACMRALRQ